MFKGLNQLFPGFVWLAILAGLAVALVLLLSGTPSWRTAQTQDTPTTELATAEATIAPATAEATAETPTAVATTEPMTATVEATTTPTDTPTLQVTPTPIPSDTIPIDAAPTGEAILYTAYPYSAEGNWEGSIRFAPIDENEAPEKSFPVTFPVDFDPMLDPIWAVSPNGLVRFIGRCSLALRFIAGRATTANQGWVE